MALSAGIALGIAWPLSFLTPVIAAKLLTLPKALSPKQGAGFVVVLSGALVLSRAVLIPTMDYPVIHFLITGLILFLLYYWKAGGGNPVLVVLLMLGVLVVPLAATVSEALAMAIRYAADARLDLLTVDGSGGGTGMSPWNMMEHWGIPSLPLHARTYEYCKVLEERGIAPPDISFAGGFAREDHIFKALALGAPYTKLVCMGRAPMIPGFLGSNIEGVFKPERRAELAGHWEKLPSTVNGLGNKPEEIFAGWESVREKLGDNEMKIIPFGAVAMFGYADKLSCGLQQFMAGARKFSIDQLQRSDLLSANRETADVTGIPFMTDAQNEQALAILREE